MDTKEEHHMGIGNVLISRLRDKGLIPVEIPRLVKDAYYIIHKGMVSGRGWLTENWNVWVGRPRYWMRSHKIL